MDGREYVNIYIGSLKLHNVPTKKVKEHYMFYLYCLENYTDGLVQIFKEDKPIIINKKIAKKVMEYIVTGRLNIKNDIYFIQELLYTAKILKVHSLVLYIKNYLLHHHELNCPSLIVRKTVEISIKSSVINKPLFNTAQKREELCAQLSIPDITKTFQSKNCSENNQEKQLSTLSVDNSMSKQSFSSIINGKKAIFNNEIPKQHFDINFTERVLCMNDDQDPPTPSAKPIVMEYPKILNFENELDF